MLFLTPTDSVKTLKALRVYFVIMETFSLQWWGAGMVVCLERGADAYNNRLTAFDPGQPG